MDGKKVNFYESSKDLRKSKQKFVEKDIADLLFKYKTSQKAKPKRPKKF